MLAEAIEVIGKMATDSQKPHILHENDREIIPVLDNVVQEPVLKPPTPRKHLAGSLDALIAYAVALEGKEASVVWYNETQVVLVIDDNGHRVNTVTLPVVWSQAFKILHSYAGGAPWYQQKEFISLLRIDLAGVFVPGLLLERVRRLRFEKSSTTASVATRDRESMGREIIAAVKSEEGEIPEEIEGVVAVSITPGVSVRLGIRCAVEVDMDQCRFRLRPLPNECDRIIELTLAKVGEALNAGMESLDIPCYHGKP